MSRKFPTGKKNRKNYMYYTSDGTKIAIEAGENGVSEELIAQLHALDYAEYLSTQREDYATPVRLGKEEEGDLENEEDHNPNLVDNESDPLELLMKAVVEQEHTKELERLTKALEMLTPLQKKTVYKKFYVGMTNMAIALEEGVLEGAIRHRLAKIYAKLSKNMNKF